MFPYDFFSQPVNAELATLLIVSPLPDDEKQDWLKTLPLMNGEEKNKLKKNLQEEIKDTVKLEKLSAEKLQQKIQTLFAS